MKVYVRKKLSIVEDATFYWEFLIFRKSSNIPNSYFDPFTWAAEDITCDHKNRGNWWPHQFERIIIPLANWFMHFWTKKNTKREKSLCQTIS